MKVFKRLILIILGILLVFECYLIFSFLQGYESTKNAQSKQTIPFNGEEAPDQNDLNILIILVMGRIKSMRRIHMVALSWSEKH